MLGSFLHATLIMNHDCHAYAMYVCNAHTMTGEGNAHTMTDECNADECDACNAHTTYDHDEQIPKLKTPNMKKKTVFKRGRRHPNDYHFD